MKIIADLGKVNEDKNLVVIEKAGRHEYVICRNYDPDEGCWSSGEYIYSLTGMAEAILYYKKKIGYMRMANIAEIAISYLKDNDLLEDFMEDTDVNFDEDEMEYFEIEEDDEYE